MCSSQLHFTHAFPDPFPHSPRRPLAHPRTLHHPAPFSLLKSDPAVVCYLAPCFSIREHNHCRRLLRRPLPPPPQGLAQQRVVTICRVIMWDLLVGLQLFLQAWARNLLSPRPCVTASVKIRWMVLPCRRLCSGRCKWAMRRTSPLPWARGLYSHRRPVIASADACRHHSSLHLYICLPRLAMIPIMVHHLGVWCRMRRPITLVLYSTLPPWCRLAPRIRHHLLLLWIHPCVACPSPQVTICRHLPTVHCVLRRLAPHHPQAVCIPVRCRRHRSMKVL